MLGYILTRKQISTVKEFEKPKTEKRKNEKRGEIARKKKKKKNDITSVDHGNALPLIDRFSFFPFISFGFRLLKNVFYFFSVPSFHLLFFLWAAFTSFPFASFLVSLPCLLAFRFVMDS